MPVKQIATDKIIDNKNVIAIELSNNIGSYVKIFNYGAIINKFIIVNKRGEKQDIVLGFDNFEQYISADYLANYCYFGAVIGRYANRIKNGTFNLEDKTYQLATNNGTNNLHGGNIGFDKKVWDIVSSGEEHESFVTLKYVSLDGEEGFPGNLTTLLTFELTDNNELILSFEAYTDAPTAINLTHHSYFNLAKNKAQITKHIHKMPTANYFLEQDETSAATGNLLSVEGTPHDFRAGKAFDENWDSQNGYDQTYVLDKEYGDLTFASQTVDPESGLTLNVYTTEPAVHLYTSKYLSIKNGKDGKDYKEFDGFCVETQHHSNAVNLDHFDDTTLYPDELYTQTTIYKVIV